MEATSTAQERLRGGKKVELESLLDAVAKSPRSLLMLDFDGTLAPFRMERHHAFPFAGVNTLLTEIGKTGKTRIVIVSGRDAKEIVPLISSLQSRPEIWGLHGLQRMAPDGSVEFLPLDGCVPEALAAAGGWLLSQGLGHAAEFKTGSIAVHWRGLDEAQTQIIRQQVKPNWTAIAKHHGLRLLEFDGGLEIRARGTNKGSVVHTLLSEMNPTTPAAYLGDDITDEDAFHAIDGLGLSVLVRPNWRPTAARFWLRPPDELLRLLLDWLDAARSSSPSIMEKVAT